MYAICEYPAVFGGAACLSTHWTGVYTADNNPIPESIFKYISIHLPKAENHRIYFVYGTETLDRLNEHFQLKANMIMKAKGYTTKNWITKKFQGDDHSEKPWSKRLHIPMIFLLGK